MYVCKISNIFSSELVNLSPMRKFQAGSRTNTNVSEVRECWQFLSLPATDIVPLSFLFSTVI